MIPFPVIPPFLGEAMLRANSWTPFECLMIVMKKSIAGQNILQRERYQKTSSTSCNYQITVLLESRLRK